MPVTIVKGMGRGVGAFVEGSIARAATVFRNKQQEVSSRVAPFLRFDGGMSLNRKMDW
jgi:hypothetical protein